MIDCDHGHGLRTRPHGFKPGNDLGGRLRFGIIDMGRASKGGRPLDRDPEFGGERLIEMLLGPLQHEAEPVKGQVLAETMPDQLGRVIADGVSGIVDAPRGCLTDRLACVEDAVHGRKADAGGRREIVDRRTPSHAIP